jgi:hypothetical protein
MPATKSVASVHQLQFAVTVMNVAMRLQQKVFLPRLTWKRELQQIESKHKAPT